MRSKSTSYDINGQGRIQPSKKKLIKEVNAVIGAFCLPQPPLPTLWTGFFSCTYTFSISFGLVNSTGSCFKLTVSSPNRTVTHPEPVIPSPHRIFFWSVTRLGPKPLLSSHLFPLLHPSSSFSPSTVNFFLLVAPTPSLELIQACNSPEELKQFKKPSLIKFLDSQGWFTNGKKSQLVNRIYDAFLCKFLPLLLSTKIQNLEFPR